MRKNEKPGYTEFCISPYGTEEATKKVWEERQKRRERPESSGSLWIDFMEREKRRTQGAEPPHHLGANRFGRGADNNPNGRYTD